VVNKSEGVFETVLEGLADVESHIVVTVGPDVDPARLGPQPDNVFVERFIPQALLLPRCRAVVAHAGAGTMLGALAHGVPQVLLPHGAEQFLNAAACAHAGAALVLDPDEIGAGAVRSALARVLEEDGFARAARGLQQEIAAMPTADEALAAIADGAR
jgi:MGT family glycosyltransferase